MYRRKILTGVLLVAMMAAVSACGVKSAPAQPEESSFPRVYPAQQKGPEATKTSKDKAAPYTSGYTRNSSAGTSGVYTPPPPATETLVK